MKVIYKSAAEKYLRKCSARDYARLVAALAGLAALKGNIVPLKGKRGVYRLKVPPYRIIFEYTPGSDTITVTGIKPRGDAYK
jgi:mRNA-degrading endonuclease RelE of RelBE toxin-antitoxin system